MLHRRKPETDLVARMDPLSFGRSLAELAAALASQLQDIIASIVRWSGRVTRANFAALAVGWELRGLAW